MSTELYFERTGIEKLDDFLDALEEAPYYIHDCTRWEEISWKHPYLKGDNPYESVKLVLDELVVNLKRGSL